MAASPAAMIEIEGLVRRFGPLTAVGGVSFQVAQGEVLGFLGPNGAGKSTTMKMITGFLTPTEGRIRVCGHDVVEAPIAAKACIGYLPEGAPAYPDMTPVQFLDFIADVRGIKGAAKQERIGRVMTQVQIEGVAHQSIDTLSKGFKRRVGIAQAILHDPQVLILDEPTDGLDPNQKHEVRGLIKAMSKDKAIVISTHILEEVDAVCTRALIIAGGRVIADGTPVQLLARSRYHNAVSVRLEGAVNGAAAELKTIAGVTGVETTEDGRLIVLSLDGKPIADQVAGLARARGWQVRELFVEAGRLDEVFRRVTVGEGART
jgi:ABC-2 type transport system ATP-binding protein